MHPFSFLFILKLKINFDIAMSEFIKPNPETNNKEVQMSPGKGIEKIIQDTLEPIYDKGPERSDLEKFRDAEDKIYEILQKEVNLPDVSVEITADDPEDLEAGDPYTVPELIIKSEGKEVDRILATEKAVQEFIAEHKKS